MMKKEPNFKSLAVSFAEAGMAFWPLPDLNPEEKDVVRPLPDSRWPLPD